MKPKLSVYIATSIDGFIARKDGAIDWLEFDSGGDSDGEDYGFAKFFESVDLLLMGRHTFEKLLREHVVLGDAFRVGVHQSKV